METQRQKISEPINMVENWKKQLKPPEKRLAQLALTEMSFNFEKDNKLSERTLEKLEEKAEDVD